MQEYHAVQAALVVLVVGVTLSFMFDGAVVVAPERTGRKTCMSLSTQPGFHAIHANHLEDLWRAVVWISRQDPLPPLASETFLVQSNGIAQWLKLALAEDDTGDAGGLGIAAGMEFLFPARFIWQAYRAVLPQGEVPEESPFDKQRLVWRLYRLLPALSDEAVFQPLKRFLAGADAEVRCHQLAEKIADLFDQYQVFRADWLQAWEEGADHIVLARGEVRELAPDLRWQPVLWRALVADTGELSATSRARVHTRFMVAGEDMDSGSLPSGIPPRIVVFGVSSLPRQALEALHVLSQVSQIVLCVHNPCQFYWADIVSDRDLLRQARRRGRLDHPAARLTDPELLHQHAHPLLAAWGKQGRDYIRLLDEFDQPDSYRDRLATPGNSIDIYRPHGAQQGDRLLASIQNDIYNLTPLAEIRAEARTVDPCRDRSLVFHQAHSPQREVEILHDQLLAAFSQSPELRPRDVIVMVPDINAYAPHIQAVFGRYGPEDDRYIPFTISDQGQRHRQPLLIALETLLSLPERRFGVSEVISLLEVPALRQRFGVSETDLPQLRQWVEGANIRWGLHPQQRASLELPERLQRNTWEFGLQRMLLGYSMGHDAHWQSVESYGEVAGLQAGLAGQMARLIERLEALWQSLNRARGPRAWLALLTGLLVDFFEQPDEQDQLIIRRLQEQAERWLQDCERAGLDGPLPLTIVRDVWLQGLDEGGLNQRFLAGKVNFATLMPMRAIPFRHVCLLGMNDGDYPRSRPPVDFDLMASDYRPGDRSRREDDRYLFLEALLSARDQLYISWVGRSIRDDSERPPSVLVAQLRDHLNDGWKLDRQNGGTVADALTVQHPLQPFSADYFPPENQPEQSPDTVLGAGRLFTYDREWRSVHQAGATPVRPGQPLAPLALTEPLPVESLSRFLQGPVEAFFSQRLQIRFSDVETVDTDNETFRLEGLEQWRLEDELIRQVVMKSGDEDTFHDALTARLDAMAGRGDLGMGITEQQLRRDLQTRVPDMFRRYLEATASWPEPVIDPLPFSYRPSEPAGDLVIEGALDRLRRNPGGDWCRLVMASSKLLDGSGRNARIRYSRLLPHWVLHLVAQTEGLSLTTLVIAKEQDKTIRMAPQPPQEAAARLDGLIAAWQEGMTRPLPADPETAFAWLSGLHKPKGGGKEEAWRQAEAAWQTRLSRDTGYLRGVWPEFQGLMDTGEFEHWLHTLYEDVRLHSEG